MPTFKIQQHVLCLDTYVVEAENREEAILAVLNGEAEAKECSEFVDVDHTMGASLDTIDVSCDGPLLQWTRDDLLESIYSVEETE